MSGASDTIVAVATPPGQGGVGIVRLSGPSASGIAQMLFRPSHPGTGLANHRLVHGVLIEPRTGAVLDESLVCLMRQPHSLTGEDVAELQCHGSPAVLQQVVACCLHLGARAADRGEFTLRAFLNGRVDLAQAEAVMSLVQARTATAAQVAAQGLTGALRRSLEPLVESITGALAYLEATIDFVEEDLPERAAPHLAGQLAVARQGLAALLQRAAHGAVLRDGLRVVLTGKPNVGKSSLLNAILRRDRAIVTEIAGTTRDTLEEVADIHGLPMFFIDTAGLSDTADPVERLGIARSTEALRSAGIVALLVDAGTPPDEADQRAAQIIQQVAPATPIVLVLNKCDLSNRQKPEVFLPLLATDGHPRVVQCSAASGQGLEALEDTLADLALGGTELVTESTLIENARQRQALAEAADALARAEEGLRSGRPVELSCIDLRAGLDALGEVTGQNSSEAVLDRIFREFCIGK